MAFYRWTLLFIGVYVATVFVIETLALSMTPVLVGATLAIVGLFGVNLIAHLFVWSNRVRLGRLFSSPYSVKERPSGLRQVIAQSWPYMVSVWLALLWVNWAYSIVTGDAEREQALLLSWWVTLLFPIGDRLVNALLMRLSGANLLSNWGFDARRERFVRVVQGCLRAIFAIVALGAMAVTWQVAGSDVLSSSWGKQAVAAMVEILLTVLAAYVLYEVVSAMLERHMPDDDQPAGEIEGEGGGGGATRQETLAPLLRGVFLVVLAIVVGLSVLSALGVQILPLIAGASIVGLAVGFGSQKLVQDVISGVFFLVDDAFRRGEYIEVGEIKGTVEKISIRSMQLRHHMGALHTIPFGEIRHLTNFSRDWVMMKLKLRLTYDTDVERVRKLIKKLGQEMLDDPELGEKFLEPLKSQGVYSMEDDSAMIIRVKFMTRPGDQFTVRKTVYARIRELFEREGIEFANRMVTVKLDGAGKDELSEAQQQQVAGAALAAGGGTRLP